MNESIQLPTTLADIAKSFGAFSRTNASEVVLIALVESLDQASQLNQKDWLVPIYTPDALQPSITVVVEAIRAVLDWRSQYMTGLPGHECSPADYIAAYEVLDDWAKQMAVAAHNL